MNDQINVDEFISSLQAKISEIFPNTIAIKKEGPSVSGVYWINLDFEPCPIELIIHPRMPHPFGLYTNYDGSFGIGVDEDFETPEACINRIIELIQGNK